VHSTTSQTKLKTSPTPQQQQQHQVPLTIGEQNILLEIAAKNYPLLKTNFQEIKNLIRKRIHKCTSAMLGVECKSTIIVSSISSIISFKYLFNQVLNIKVHFDLPDLLHVMESMKKKYTDSSISSIEDFNILMTKSADY
jgi:hypothetical protein